MTTLNQFEISKIQDRELAIIAATQHARRTRKPLAGETAEERICDCGWSQQFSADKAATPRQVKCEWMSRVNRSK